jgi:hypothetical protein
MAEIAAPRCLSANANIHLYAGLAQNIMAAPSHTQIGIFNR